ncbi:MAG: NADH-quinone oxidoreductase subunit J [Thermodesulfovibrio sp.]|nr:NADH-quinone oxidoreductase subunit J [Thermodesulfovibrio sp.]
MSPLLIENVFLIYFFVSLSLLSLAVVASKNIIRSAFFLLIFLLHVAALFLFLNAEFLMVIQIIVYVGGVLVLFIFAIMVMNLKEELKHRRFIKFGLVGVLTGVVFFIGLYIFLKETKESGNFLTNASVENFGKLLFSYYLLPFEILSVVLLIALVGGLAIAKKLPKEDR